MIQVPLTEPSSILCYAMHIGQCRYPLHIHSFSTYHAYMQQSIVMPLTALMGAGLPGLKIEIGPGHAKKPVKIGQNDRKSVLLATLGATD